MVCTSFIPSSHCFDMSSATVRCTEVVHYVTTKSKTPKVKQCRNKYCKACLKNRYNEDIEVVLKAQEVNHEHNPTFRLVPARLIIPRVLTLADAPSAVTYAIALGAAKHKASNPFGQCMSFCHLFTNHVSVLEKRHRHQSQKAQRHYFPLPLRLQKLPRLLSQHLNGLQYA